MNNFQGVEDSDDCLSLYLSTYPPQKIQKNKKKNNIKQQ